MNPWLLVVLIWLATYRLTVLVTDDKITRPIVDPVQEWFEKRWLAKHLDGDRNSSEWQSQWAWLLGCPWCCSVYIGAAVTVIADVWFEPVPLPALVAISASGVTGFLSSVVDHD